MQKDFIVDFYMMLERLSDPEGFSFGRYSDGELRVLQNMTLILGDDTYQIGEQVFPWGTNYNKAEQKEFIPDQHKFYYDKLVEAFTFRKKNYYKGLSCRCCVGEQDFQWQLDLYGPGDEEHLTWANVLINCNYPSFVEEMIPEFKQHDVILVCSDTAEIDNLGFDVKKDFRVGPNCMVNDYGIIEEIKQYIETNNIENHLFLFAAATLSNYLAHQLFEFNDTNKYMDIGSTLAPLMKMDGWQRNRAYLKKYWLNDDEGDPSGYADRTCIW
tara:strand:+ start:3097 stop:3906 length:810 start_codon:yes stop_codon:yes gene_type:complete